MRSAADVVRRRDAFAVFALAIAMGIPAVPADPRLPSYDEALVKAEMVERFCRFVEWPEFALGGLEDSFVIGLIANDAVGERIEALARGRLIQGHRVEVRHLDTPADVLSCHLVWVGSGERKRIGEVLARTRGRPILTVGDAPGLAESGVLINIVPHGDRLGFEINLTEVESSGLRFSSKLLRLARIVAAMSVEAP